MNSPEKKALEMGLESDIAALSNVSSTSDLQAKCSSLLVKIGRGDLPLAVILSLTQKLMDMVAKRLAELEQDKALNSTLGTTAGSKSKSSVDEVDYGAALADLLEWRKINDLVPEKTSKEASSPSPHGDGTPGLPGKGGQ